MRPFIFRSPIISIRCPVATFRRVNVFRCFVIVFRRVVFGVPILATRTVCAFRTLVTVFRRVNIFRRVNVFRRSVVMIWGVGVFWRPIRLLSYSGLLFIRAGFDLTIRPTSIVNVIFSFTIAVCSLEHKSYFQNNSYCLEISDFIRSFCPIISYKMIDYGDLLQEYDFYNAILNIYCESEFKVLPDKLYS